MENEYIDNQSKNSTEKILPNFIYNHNLNRFDVSKNSTLVQFPMPDRNKYINNKKKFR